MPEHCVYMRLIFLSVYLYDFDVRKGKKKNGRSEEIHLSPQLPITYTTLSHVFHVFSEIFFLVPPLPVHTKCNIF